LNVTVKVVTRERWALPSLMRTPLTCGAAAPIVTVKLVSTNAPSLSVVVPVYNSVDMLPALVAQHIPEMQGALYFGHPGNRGDAAERTDLATAGLRAADQVQPPLVSSLPFLMVSCPHPRSVHGEVWIHGGESPESWKPKRAQ
jgi:hypothetical protein